jgi:hypothetical protein
VDRTRLVVSFRLSRRARVGLVASRRGRVVGRARTRTLRPGAGRLSIRLSRKRWPTRLRFVTRDLELPAGTPGAGGGEVPTPDAVST